MNGKRIFVAKIPSRFLRRAAIVFALFLVYIFLSNKHIGVTRYVVESPKIGPELDGFRIVQVSDLHNARFGRGQSRLLRKIRECGPDLVALTGDIVDESGIDAGIELVEGVARIAPSFFVPGNHEPQLEEGESIRFFDAMEAAGVRNLDWCSTNFPNGLSLAGQGSLFGVLDGGRNLIPPDAYKVVLVHYPSAFEDCVGRGFDLVLAGHIHGGGVRLPFLGGLASPEEGFFPKYYQGVHERDGSTLVISRGLGNYMRIPRVFNDPELVCIELRAVSASEKPPMN